MKFNPINAWTAGSAILLVGSQTLAVAAATAWAIAGLMHLSSAFSSVLMGIGLLVGLAATAAFAREAYRAEPFFGPAGTGAAFSGPSSGGSMEAAS